MGTLFKIARGTKASLDSRPITDGTFYVIPTDGEAGELYGDIGNRRIKFGGGAVAKTAEEWESEDKQSAKGTFYIVEDAYEDAPALKIGDGETNIADLPIVTISPTQIASWNSKVRALDPAEGSENLIFTVN